ncbi:hypothetical protein [Methylobacterium sp. Leaf99]|uniref:hypothetical protein n=1 Tax=Methylobacterium sp. Leaf99 TaxID=1736251 RepID=UPI000B30BB79|nr:hypothetical protein [Methylobacterium sp. Leaf99]
MSLQGVHIACGFISAPQNVALLGAVAWSETLAAAGTTVNIAPSSLDTKGSPAPAYPGFEITASVDCYVAIGKAPDAVNGARIYVRAGETRNIFCQTGDKLSWAAA